VIDCNEWKTEKRHECANMGKVKDPNYDGTVSHITSGSGLGKFQADGFFFRQSVLPTKFAVANETVQNAKI